jgi:lambda family phage portal protein
MSEVVAARRRDEQQARLRADVEAARAELETERNRGRVHKRAYQAALVNRLTADFATSAVSANAELRKSLRRLRERSRDLAQNNPHVKKFLSLVRTNVIGHGGIKLQATATRPGAGGAEELDEELNRRVERAWAEWGHKETASASGRLSWLDQQHLFVTTLARDGEALCRILAADNPFGFTLQFIDVAWLDETFNARLGNGNRVLMSVEVDKYNRPVNYWLTPPSYDYLYPEREDAQRRTPVPASQMIHCFVVNEDESQTRGVPWTHAAMLRLKMLAGYEEAEVIAARLEACKGVFLIPPEGDEEGGYAGDGDEAVDAPLLEEIEPGMSTELPPGYKVETFDPQHPNANGPAFAKWMLRSIATTVDVAYVSLGNDLEGVNYSSIRAGLLDERSQWRIIQSFVVEHFCRTVYRAWLRSSVAVGGIEGVGPREYDRLKSPLWRPRGWPWVDPLNDMKASLMAIDNALETRTDVAGEQGESFPEIVAKLKNENDLLEKNGLPVKADAKEPPAGGQPGGGEQDEEQTPLKK